MSEARVLTFRQRVIQIDDFRHTRIADAQHGRFMMVRDIDTLDDQLDDLPDHVVAFAFRRMVREFRLGRALDDSEAARKLRKHASTVQRLRSQHGNFLALMDGASGHARHKFLTRKSAKSSNFLASKLQQTCQTAPPEEDPSGKNSPLQESSLPEGGQKAPDAAPCLEGSTAPAQEEQRAELRTSPETPSSPAQSDGGRPAAEPNRSRGYADLTDEEKTAQEVRMADLRARSAALAEAWRMPGTRSQAAPALPRDDLDAMLDRYMERTGGGVPQPPNWLGCLDREATE